MNWYKNGTVSVVQNSNAVIGTGSAFIANGRVGDAFQGPDGDWYEVTNIASDTAMSIAPNYKSATNTAGAYALAPMQGYNKDTADALRAASLQVGEALDGLEESVLEAANSAGTATAAKNASVASAASSSDSAAAALLHKEAAGLSETHTAEYEAAALASRNAASTSETNAGDYADDALVSKNAAATSEANAAASAGVAAGLGVGPGYIEGLIPQWNTSTSISVTPGTACIQGTGYNLLVPSTLTLSGLSLTSNTWYYLYLYDNSGTAAIELVTTAPAAPYVGMARSKTGDTSRRFLCSLLSSAGVGLQSFQIDSSGILRYRALLSVAPFRVVSAASNTTPVTVSLSDLVPLTTQTVLMIVTNASASVVVFMSLPADTASIFNRVGISANMQLTMITNASQKISFQNSAAGGSTTFDVAGYGMDR